MPRLCWLAVIIAVALITAPLAADAEPKTYRLRILCTGSAPDGVCRLMPATDPVDGTIMDELCTLGYVVGQHLTSVEAAGGPCRSRLSTWFGAR
jgi:hypothetical protein